jgi:hypothetical protein
LARIARFRTIIENHHVYEVGIGFRIDEYRRAFDPFTKPKDNPYYFGSATLMTVDVLPLQAADMHATYLRICFDAAHAEQPSPPLPGFTKLRRGFIIMLTEAELQERARRIAASIGQDDY